MKRKVRDLLFEALRAEGIQHVFGNPGTTELPLLDGFVAHDDIKYITCLHEAIAVGGAMGYSLATGKPGVAIVHVAPGLAHGLGNLYTAHRGQVPLVLLAGQVDTKSMIHEPVLTGDLVTMARPFTKWSYEVRSAADMAIALPRAFKVAMAPPRGPVFLSLPMDVMRQETGQSLPAIRYVGEQGEGDRDEIARAARLLAAAERPLILAGDAVGRHDALAELAALAESAAAGVVMETNPTANNFPTDHPLFLGHLSASIDVHRQAFQGSDLVILAGYTAQAPLPWHPGEPYIPAGARTIHLHPDPWELGKNCPGDAMICGHPRITLAALTRSLKERLTPDVTARISQRRTAIEARARLRCEGLAAEVDAAWDQVPINPVRLMRELADQLPHDAVVVGESISNAKAVVDHIPFHRHDSYMTGKGGGLGHSMGTAIGFKAAAPQRTVVSLIGDGSALYYPQALWTAAHHGIAIPFIIINNTSYRILKQFYRHMADTAGGRGGYPGMEIVNPTVDFVTLAEAFGVQAVRISDPGDIASALRAAFASAKPSVIDVAVGQIP